MVRNIEALYALLCNGRVAVRVHVQVLAAAAAAPTKCRRKKSVKRWSNLLFHSLLLHRLRPQVYRSFVPPLLRVSFWPRHAAAHIFKVLKSLTERFSLLLFHGDVLQKMPFAFKKYGRASYVGVVGKRVEIAFYRQAPTKLFFKICTYLQDLSSCGISSRFAPPSPRAVPRLAVPFK